MKHWILWLLLCGLLFGCTPEAPAPSEEEAFTLSFITVGKGDAFLLSTPEGQHYLVDTGKAEDFPQILGVLGEKQVEALDGIFLSHGHKDHAGGLDFLLTVFPTQAVYVSGRDDVSYTEILPEEICAAHAVPLQKLSGGEVLDLGGVLARVWIPPSVDRENANNNSMVLRLEYGSTAFLLMGDAEREEEAQILQSDFPLSAELLKLGHHGEDDATTPAFLARVSPNIGLICGNQRENPDSLDPKVLNLLKQSGVRAYVSECDGLALDFRSDGQRISEEVLPDTRENSASLEISQPDRKHQSVELRNTGTEAFDLTGCFLVSEKGHETYFFPAGTQLPAGKALTVSCVPGEGDLHWAEETVWKKRDPAKLYDPSGFLLAESPS